MRRVGTCASVLQLVLITFFRLQVYERVGMSLVELYESVGKSVILVCKKAQKGQMIHFMPVKGSRKRAGAALKGR